MSLIDVFENEGFHYSPKRLIFAGVLMLLISIPNSNFITSESFNFKNGQTVQVLDGVICRVRAKFGTKNPNDDNINRELKNKEITIQNPIIVDTNDSRSLVAYTEDNNTKTPEITFFNASVTNCNFSYSDVSTMIPTDLEFVTDDSNKALVTSDKGNIFASETKKVE